LKTCMCAGRRVRSPMIATLWNKHALSMSLSEILCARH